MSNFYVKKYMSRNFQFQQITRIIFNLSQVVFKKMTQSYLRNELTAN